MARTATKKDVRSWQGCGETETLIHCWKPCEMVQLTWKSLVVPQKVRDFPSDLVIFKKRFFLFI